MGTAMKIITPQVMGHSHWNRKRRVDSDDEVSALSPTELLRSRSEWRLNLVLHIQSAPDNAWDIHFRSVWLCLFSCVILSLAPGLEGGTTLESQEVISAIDKAQECRERKLAGYVAMEHYTVRNSHFGEVAELMANVRYEKGIGKRYQVLWRRGPEFLQGRVINRILMEDATLSGPSARTRTLFTSANYSMKVQGTQMLYGKLCYVVDIRPRAHNFSLIEGTAWVDSRGFSLLRIEGRPAASPSFWTGRPFIEREYTVSDGLSFPQHSRATSKGFFAGRSELDIDYSKYEISGYPMQNKNANRCNGN
jgi:hypothetical protein